MTCDAIQERVEDLKGQNIKILQELVLIVFLVQAVLFVIVWFYSWWEYVAYANLQTLADMRFHALQNYSFPTLIVSLFLLIYIVWFFWRLRNKPRFQVFFIETTKWQGQHDITIRYLALLLVLCATISLSFTSVYYVKIFPGEWYDSDSPPMVVFYPLMAAASLSVLCYFVYRNKRERVRHEVLVRFKPEAQKDWAVVQGIAEAHAKLGAVVKEEFRGVPGLQLVKLPRDITVPDAIAQYQQNPNVLYAEPNYLRYERAMKRLPWLLFIPILPSIYLAENEITSNIFDFYNRFLAHKFPPPGSAAFLDDAVFFGFMSIILTSFIVLFYLTYFCIKTENSDFLALKEKGYLKNSALVEERNLGDYIGGGAGILPAKIRANNSYSVPLCLKLSDNFTKRSSRYFEAEIQAIGLHVVGEKRLKIDKTSTLPVAWNCCFTQTGNHVMSLAINLVTPANDSRQLIFRREHVLQVDSFLSTSWAPVLALITPILVTLVQVLLKGG